MYSEQADISAKEKIMEFLSVKEIADSWLISERQVRNRCKQNKIPGCQKVGKNWIIPVSAKNSKAKSLQQKFFSKKEQKALKYNYVIIHGTFGHPGENWFPWLAEQIALLDETGVTQREDILTPHFPSSSSADYDSWKSILMGYVDSGIINKKTIFICHSLGPLFVSRVLIEEKIKVKGMISVEAAANHLMGNENFDKINKTFFVPSWEYLNKVKKYISFNYCFYTDNDPHIPYNILQEYIKHASTKAFFIPGAGHFNTASGYSQFPQILELIKDIEANAEINESEIENLSVVTNWSKSLSHKWTNMTWPNRPSVSELALYTNYLRKKDPNKRKSVLLLGSNVEFRDWAYEENLDLCVMNNDEEYHLATYRELRHKNLPYKLFLQDWRLVNFDNEFDFVVGDALIGNLNTTDIEPFVARVAKSLLPGGYFFSKSYYIPRNYKTKKPEDIFADFNKNAKALNPIAYCNFDLTMCCLNKNQCVEFDKINNVINKLFCQKLITEETYETFSNIGLDEMKYQFFVPHVEEYERIVKKYFIIEDVLWTNDVGSENFPLYILRKK